MEAEDIKKVSKKAAQKKEDEDAKKADPKITKKERLAEEIEKVTSIGLRKGGITIEEVSERFSNLGAEEIDEVLRRLAARMMGQANS